MESPGSKWRPLQSKVQLTPLNVQPANVNTCSVHNYIIRINSEKFRTVDNVNNRMIGTIPCILCSH